MQGDNMGKIIQFPEQVDLMHPPIVDSEPATYETPPPKEPEPIKEPEPEKEVDVIRVMPDEPMPDGYPDYRHLLYRDGLFPCSLVYWKEKGLFVVNWFRTAGQFKKLESDYCREKDLESVMPVKQGYWSNWFWNRGNEPDYMAIFTPERMDRNDRPSYLVKLRNAGVKINFDYEFTLAKHKSGIEGKPKPLPVTERLIMTVKQAISQPETALDHLDNFVSAICADGTVDRWGPPMSNKELLRKQKKEWRIITGTNWA